MTYNDLLRDAVFEGLRQSTRDDVERLRLLTRGYDELMTQDFEKLDKFFAKLWRRRIDSK